jgi:hypothetical protein
MPRAAVLSIHARVAGTEPTVLDDESLVQVWGPRFSVYVVAARDVGVFTVGRLSDGEGTRPNAHDIADRLEAVLDGSPMTSRQAGRALGVHPNWLRYAAPTGRVLIRWDGARQPTIWTVPPPQVDPPAARRELARRYLHTFGPTTAGAFAQWAGIARDEGISTFDKLHRSLTPVRTPIGDAWILSRDEPSFAVETSATHSVRLLPSGDAFYLLQGGDRELLVTEPERRRLLWTSRVWPGAVLVDDEIVGTWRRSGNKLTVHPWWRISQADRDGVESEAESLPLPGGKPATVRWQE